MLLSNSKKNLKHQKSILKKDNIFVILLHSTQKKTLEIICIHLDSYFTKNQETVNYLYFIRYLENAEKTLLSVLMTTYGFEHELVEPIVKHKIKVIYILY